MGLFLCIYVTCRHIKFKSAIGKLLQALHQPKTTPNQLNLNKNSCNKKSITKPLLKHYTYKNQ